VAANSILERGFGKPREQNPEELQQAQIDLSTLTSAELALLMKLVDSGVYGQHPSRSLRRSKSRER
jgi:hypothetical protein